MEDIAVQLELLTKQMAIQNLIRFVSFTSSHDTRKFSANDQEIFKAIEKELLETVFGKKKI